ncbi:hypothetical protein RRG08_009050 [Elysia crispata]|uniref:Uncharacterized protein n=1 Tax=Elysia crispata TaxID=231223 RepID=A0AAE1ABE5_9GAST|nr:hypothetical protein RRG08_009050 [Elysia crispata]
MLWSEEGGVKVFKNLSFQLAIMVYSTDSLKVLWSLTTHVDVKLTVIGTSCLNFLRVIGDNLKNKLVSTDRHVLLLNEVDETFLTITLTVHRVKESEITSVTEV